MTGFIDPMAGEPVPRSQRINPRQVRDAYFELRPDPTRTDQRVAFGTSGHRGSSFEASFNEWHVLAMTQAICDVRRAHGIDGPLFLGVDTHALSAPARMTAIEVLAANEVPVMLAGEEEAFTPTPVISHAIVSHNRTRKKGWADGVVITPSHNPPEEGGLKYNPPNGGPASKAVTDSIERAANAYLGHGLHGVQRLSMEAALRSASTCFYPYREQYIRDLDQVVDMDALRAAGLRMAVDPLGGAGVNYWGHIAERYRLDLTVVSEEVDPAFGFMRRDHDGRIRMDPSSPWAMKGLVGMAGDYDFAFACDTDHDRHGIITPESGVMAPNHYLSVLADFLFRHRSGWRADAALGKTMVTTALLDRVADRLGRPLYEVPVGFKWFVEGLLDGSVAFGGEESAGAAPARRDGEAWTTDKDGIAAALLAGEVTAVLGRNPAERYAELTRELGEPVFERVDSPIAASEKRRLQALGADDIQASYLAGDPVTSVLDRAPGNLASFGGIKVATAQGWFAARPSGTESLYKLYGESFRDRDHLDRILEEASVLIETALVRQAS